MLLMLQNGHASVLLLTAALIAGCRKAREMRIASSLRIVRLPWLKQVLRYLEGGGEDIIL